ncbi:MAG: hypothetical protein HYZ53_07180 [Planctomycetes bacterium]|nr:hypothetical protein [Planctomycetota bacterium]
MMCEKCQNAPASVHVILMHGRKAVKTAHLCPRCSEEGSSKLRRPFVRGRWPKGTVNPYAVSAGNKASEARWRVGLN